MYFTPHFFLLSLFQVASCSGNLHVLIDVNDLYWIVFLCLYFNVYFSGCLSLTIFVLKRTSFLSVFGDLLQQAVRVP